MFSGGLFEGSVVSTVIGVDMQEDNNPHRMVKHTALSRFIYSRVLLLVMNLA